MVTLLMLWRWALRTVYVFWEKCSLYLYQKRLTIWMACNAGNRIRRGCGKNRWKVEITDFTDAYLFFMRLATILNSEIEAHNGMEQVFYTCKLPGTSGTLLLQECPEQNGTFATIKMQANVSHVWKIKISFIRKQHKENKTTVNDIHI